MIILHTTRQAALGESISTTLNAVDTYPTVLVPIAELRGDSAWVTHYLPHFLLGALVGGNVHLRIGDLFPVENHFDFLLLLLDL